MESESIRKEISCVILSQRLAVLATERDGQPYASLMAYACTDDLTRIVVATARTTRKNTNLKGEARVSLLIDNRKNQEADFHEASALTVVGEAMEVQPDDYDKYAELYLTRHPYLKKFIEAPTTALYQINVHHYLLVNRFQNVMELHMTDEHDIFTEKSST